MKKKILFLLYYLLFLFAVFPQNDFSNIVKKFDNEKYIYPFLLNVLKSQNKDTIHNYSDVYKDFSVSDMDGDRIINWESIFTMDEIKVYYSSSQNQKRIIIGKDHVFIIDDLEIKNNKIIFSGSEYTDFNKQTDSICPINWNPVREFNNFIFIFVFEGDYLNIYFNQEDSKHLFYSFCKVSDETYKQVENHITTNKCDLSKVTWSRHADGSCDYDGSKKAVTVQTAKATPSTNVVPNKTMLVSENLKLRSAEATTSEVITVMSAGTKVKILELGKAENIDGISSNWVKVEVQSGAKDRDGRTIRAGTVGWCYGGYLK